MGLLEYTSVFPAAILLFLTTNHIVGGKIISVYRNAGHSSDKADVDIDTCSNLPQNLAGEVTSVDTNNMCARFYSAWNCTGDALEILSASPSHYDLTNWGWNDKAFSIGPCLDPCDDLNTGGVPKEPFNISVFGRPDFKGAYDNVVVDGCTRVSPQFVHQFQSVVTDGQCVQLWANPRCTSQGKIDGHSDTIELRNGTPKHNDIMLSWYFKRVRAVSHCSFKCNRTSDDNMDGEGEPGIGEITLFDDTNFSGYRLTVKVENECVNLEGMWDGIAMSVKANLGKCGTLFDRRNCTGKAFNFLSNETNLNERNFGEVTRSVRYCDWSDDGGKFLVGGGQIILSPGVISGFVVVGLVVVGVFVGVVFGLLRKMRMERSLSEREIREFLKGFARDGSGDQDSGIGGGCENSGFGEDFQDVEVVAVNAAYNMRYEVERGRFSFDSTLGMGEFGIVYKGTLSIEGNDKEQITVAVKTLKSDANVGHLRSLMKEVKVMLYISDLGQHPNIVRVMGCCTEMLRHGDLFMLMEYCCNGSLESFLRKNRGNFTSIVKYGMVDKSMVAHHKNKSLLSEQGNKEVTSAPHFNLFQQLWWIIEIASGMEFLAASKIVHRDLAARNILLDAQFQAKISDFGLSRKMYNYAGYLKKGEEPVPWKWLALESILNATYTSKSDVWSFGVVCWEIFSLGEEPFVGEVWGEEFVKKLGAGYRLGRPTDCVREIYQLMLHWWNNGPSDRPSFSEITRHLKQIEKMLSNPVAENRQLPSGYVDSFVIEV